MKRFHSMNAWYNGDRFSSGEFYSYNTQILQWDNCKNIIVGRCVGISSTTMRQTTRFLRETFELDLSPKVLRRIAHGEKNGELHISYGGTTYCLLPAAQGCMQFNAERGTTPCETNYVSW